MPDDVTGRLYRLFAGLLEYPTPALAGQAQEVAALLPSCGVLAGFCSFVEQTPPGRLEELYTATFDLQAMCYPYVGYHLFGDSYKRGMFMARLNQEYRERGFSAGSELPDHVAVVLRFLALGAEDEFSRALLEEGLIPALDKMAQAFGQDGENPYRVVVQALSSVLEAEP